jgi:hypothetical protein
MPEEVTIPDLVELNRRAIESAARRDLDEAMSVYGPDSVYVDEVYAAVEQLGESMG